MKLSNILERATDFGTFRSRDNFFSFSLKILLYIIPAVILGHYTDTFVKRLKNNTILGKNLFHYILLQTIFIISTLYLFILFLKEYVSEFQESSAGGYFIVLYFGMQLNYINMIKESMTV